MDSHGPEGPDASSLKPVSSLRAQFENMNTGKGPPPAPPPARNQSPSPNPPPVPDSRPVRNQSSSPQPPPVPDTRPARFVSAAREDSTPKLQLPKATEFASASRAAQMANPPPLSPKPIRPPSVLVDPPHSPPKARVFPAFPLDTSAHLNPDPSKSPAPSVASSPRAFKIPSRPDTPVLEARRSPHLSVSQPPSPPPPRRSAELRREREARPAPGIPPPINRSEKPGNRLSSLMDTIPSPDMIPMRSPFNSPPASASSPETEEPPELPTRPARPAAPQASVARTGAIPSNTGPTSFEPPPLHHTLVGRRREQDVNGHARAPPIPPPVQDRPALPVRAQSVIEPSHHRGPTHSAMRPPPRPPRIGAVKPSVQTDMSITQNAKRVVSSPATQFAPPPSRAHGRTMTVDRMSEKTPAEFREPPRRVATAEEPVHHGDSPAPGHASSTQITTSYPDSSRVNRRPPFIKQGIHEIYTKYDTRIFDVCGQYVCTGGQLTRVWSLLDGDLLMSFAYGEGVKATSVAFKPGLNVDEEGTRLWIGNSIGEVMEADVATQTIVGNKTNVHGRYEVIKIFRHFNEMWTLDDGGTLHVWGPDSEGLPTLSQSPHQTYRLPKTHTFSMIVGEELWHAAGKEIRVFAPTTDGRNQVQVLMRPLVSEGAGEVTCGTVLESQPGKIFFGHVDGKVSIYSSTDYRCLGVLNVSTYKINSLAGVGRYIWAAYNTGKICVYDVEKSPWIIKKDWQAHDNPTIRILADRAGFYRINRLQVISLGADNMVRAWDGLLQDDFMEDEMKRLDTQYCQFEDLKLLALTWNAGASTPSSLRNSESDAAFVQNLLQSSDSPDILIFGFQELVDLEDKKATAKRLFKSSKKKDTSDHERMSHQYRDWRDYLVRSLDDYMPTDHLYHLLHTSTLVGLFTCIFVRSTIQGRIRNLSTADVKRGLGGLHGNKGAIVVRFMVDDTSLCFINCHLAAGQSQANARHNDIAAIMESSLLPVERDPSVRIDSYIGGGDGTMILDHELCLLNGDLNYRIDTMSRDTVVYAVRGNNLGKLLDRDQLLVARRRNPAFKLRAFDEMPIQFAPTYKYDVGTDNYDSSEKQRSPAWCDRLLHRGSGRIQQLEYRRHEVRVSDHRPVTGRFVFTVKAISPKKRAMTWADCHQRFENLREKEAHEHKYYYLTKVIGYDPATSERLIQDRAARRVDRSPSRQLTE
ncbi:Endonuclease/exonuclease/phosphatase [Xylariaceae sp. FL0804]|nr:Endonuclease/exonuclease/phosphatase [Xylariaceae sp. FL0804]